jgi:hypothetical protein
MIAATVIGLVVPVLTVVLVNRWTRRKPAATASHPLERQDA